MNAQLKYKFLFKNCFFCLIYEHVMLATRGFLAAPTVRSNI